MKPYVGKLFKVLDNRKSCHGGDHLWVPGEWVRVDGKLIPCHIGIHLCREQDLIEWLGPEIWAAEYRGEEFIIHKNKVVVREARIITKYENWNESTARLFACDCAEKVVHLCGDDPRPAEAIRVARLFAIGKATQKELATARDAAMNNAKGAAWGATWNDAWDAARVTTKIAARDAAWDAIRAASWATAWDASWATALDAAKKWQTEQLMALLNK